MQFSNDSAAVTAVGFGSLYFARWLLDQKFVDSIIQSFTKNPGQLSVQFEGVLHCWTCVSPYGRGIVLPALSR